MEAEPRTLMEAIRYFKDPDVCLNFMASLRWPDKIVCPTCGSQEVTFMASRRIWQCKVQHSKRQFSVKVGTIFEDSALPLDKWLAVIWLVANAKNGISSYEVHRAVGVTQKSAWFMLSRIRLAMQTGTFDKMGGAVEVDETFIGGKARNMNAKTRKGRYVGQGGAGKVAVMGLLERHGEVRTKVVANTRRATLQSEVRKQVEPGAEVYTDALRSYDGLRSDYVHKVVDHAEKYVDGVVHTNGLENFWSLLKRTLTGTYISVEPFHLFRYLDEQAFRFNNRETHDSGRFLMVAASVIGKRLTYRELTGKGAV